LSSSFLNLQFDSNAHNTPYLYLQLLGVGDQVIMVVRNMRRAMVSTAFAAMKYVVSIHFNLFCFLFSIHSFKRLSITIFCGTLGMQKPGRRHPRHLLISIPSAHLLRIFLNGVIFEYWMRSIGMGKDQCSILAMIFVVLYKVITLVRHFCLFHNSQ
jgi:hypothetical protein